MKSALTALGLLGCILCYSQNYSASVNEPNLLFIDIASIKNSQPASGFIQMQYLSGFRMNLPRDYRMGLSAIIYNQNEIPVEGQTSYNLNIFIGRKKNLLEGKRSSLYMAGDLGLGRAGGYLKTGYNYNRQLTNYLDGVITMGFQVPLGWKVFLSAETGFDLNLMITERYAYDKTNGDLVEKSKHKVGYGAGLIPLRAFSIGWIL